MNRLLSILMILFMSITAQADLIDSLENELRSNPQIQEKIYIHTDNNSYFVGDTLWYKAYVLRSDDLHPTNMSKLLYVELLSPDGYVVERQHVVVSDNGVTCGQFALVDSLYSGFYELRAYTKWQLNFNVSVRDYTIVDQRRFCGKWAAQDFFRDYEGLYSRVLPVYARPSKEGEYSERYMYRRPKQRVMKEHMNVLCNFYPEGGQLVAGIPSRVAFEVSDHNGQGLDIEGTMDNGTKVKPLYMGKGVFEYTPSAEPTHLQFRWNDKNYTFRLPKAAKSGTVINYDPETRQVTLMSAGGISPKALSVTCRGRVVHFARIPSQSNAAKITYDLSKISDVIPTGVNELIVYDADAQPLASRQFFINNDDMGARLNATVRHNGEEEVTRKTTVNPFEEMTVDVSVNKEDNLDRALPKTVSVAVRDASTDEPGYDDGNIMTDILLSGDLRGFVAYPAYYFEKNDKEHRTNLDLLMMVQGWRKYKRVETMRYEPETGLTFDGLVMKLPLTAQVAEIEDFSSVGKDPLYASALDTQYIDNETSVGEALQGETGESDNTAITEIEEPEVEFATVDINDASRMKKPVIVEAELAKDGQVAGVAMRTKPNGQFSFQLPAYYDKAILRVTAYSIGDSLKKCLTSREDKGTMDDRAYPDYYVKRDMFYPIFTKPYSWYQVNSPELAFVDEDDDELIPGTSRLAGNHTLQTVVVKAKRRGRRAIDFAKPAYVRDIYQLYNDATDYGLSFGVYNAKNFPEQVATLLFGNMGRPVRFNIRAMYEGTSFYRNYTPLPTEFDKNAAYTHIFERTRLNRLLNVRAYTDYEIRTDSGDVVETNVPDVTLVFEPIPDDGKRYTYRDRRYVLDGITYPEAFYNRSYADGKPNDPADHRRTLYWNPNARLDAEGRFKDKLFNNSTESRVNVSAAGVGADGTLYYTDPKAPKAP